MVVGRGRRGEGRGGEGGVGKEGQTGGGGDEGSTVGKLTVFCGFSRPKSLPGSAQEYTFGHVCGQPWLGISTRRKRRDARRMAPSGLASGRG